MSPEDQAATVERHRIVALLREEAESLLPQAAETWRWVALFIETEAVRKDLQ